MNKDLSAQVCHLLDQIEYMKGTRRRPSSDAPDYGQGTTQDVVSVHLIKFDDIMVNSATFCCSAFLVHVLFVALYMWNKLTPIFTLETPTLTFRHLTNPDGLAKFARFL